MKTDQRPLDRWLQLNTFACPKLSARLTPAACCQRQENAPRMVTPKQGGTTFRKHNDPLSRWCSSGECELGRMIRAKENR